MVEPVFNQITVEANPSPSLNENQSKKIAADEKLEALMEKLELSFKKFEEDSESFLTIKRINKSVAALRKESPKEQVDSAIESYVSLVEKTCQEFYSRLEEILNAEKERVLELQRQSRLKFLATQKEVENEASTIKI